jgi:hypothetical protein
MILDRRAAFLLRADCFLTRFGFLNGLCLRTLM